MVFINTGSGWYGDTFVDGLNIGVIMAVFCTMMLDIEQRVIATLSSGHSLSGGWMLHPWQQSIKSP